MCRNMFEVRSLVHQSWGAVIAACDGLATWPLAISLLTTRASTLEPNVVAWNAAISSCEKSTVWQKAFEVLHFMQRRRVEADENYLEYTDLDMWQGQLVAEIHSCLGKAHRSVRVQWLVCQVVSRYWQGQARNRWTGGKLSLQTRAEDELGVNIYQHVSTT